METRFRVGELIAFTGNDRQVNEDLFGSNPFLVLAVVEPSAEKDKHYVLLGSEVKHEVRTDYTDARCERLYED